MSELDEETSYCVSDEDESGDAFESVRDDVFYILSSFPHYNDLFLFRY